MVSPNFLIAPNAFKGCLGAGEAALLLAQGVRRALPGARVDLMPISDGGDGLIEVLLRRHGGRRVFRTVTGALGAPLRACYALLADGRTAVVEMARASGIAGIPKTRLDPLGATSFGTGELIADALRRGRSRILVGMGGSATSDGGAGMAAALGARLLDYSGRELPLGAEPLLRLARIEAEALRRRLGRARVIALSDVTNPLLGPRGSARVYGPQKGASPAQVRLLERALAHYSRILARDLGARVGRLPGAGAAGGLGAGLAAFLRAALLPGARWVLDDLGAGSRLGKADWVLTGEGRADASSFFGKAPLTLSWKARAAGVPVLLACGDIDRAVLPRLRRSGVRAAAALRRPGEPAAQAMRLARRRLPGTAAALLKAAGLCAALAVFPRAETLPEIDALYLHRDQPGKLERTISVLEDRVKEEPKDAEALWRLGRSLVRLGERQEKKSKKLEQFTRAEELIGRSVEISSGVAEAQFWYGLALGRTGETRGILRSLFMVGPLKKRMRRVLELDPNHGGAHHVLGEMLRQLPGFAGGSKAGAIRELEEAVRLTPNYTAHYPALAQAYLDAGEKGKALEALRRGLEISQPEDPAEYQGDLAECRMMLGELEPKR